MERKYNNNVFFLPTRRSDGTRCQTTYSANIRYCFKPNNILYDMVFNHFQRKALMNSDSANTTGNLFLNPLIGLTTSLNLVTSPV